MILLLLGAVAQAQTWSFPTSAADYGNFYPTAYYDHSGVDWACGNIVYSGHHGSDYGVGSFAGMDAGRDVVAAASGTVVETHDGEFDRCTSGSCGAVYGNYVKIAHADGKQTLYAHLKQWTVAVSPGDTVACGQYLGLVGSSGWSTGPHLHIGAWHPTYGYVDPFDGPCSSPPSYWTSQGAHGGLPARVCDGPTCAPAGALTCGETRNTANNASGSTSQVITQGCATQFSYTGPEIAWTLTPTLSEPVTLSMTGLSADLDLFVVDGGTCDGGCVASSVSSNTNPESLTFQATAGHTYTVVVDGYDGAVSGFALDVDCTPPGCASSGSIGCGGHAEGTNDGPGSSTMTETYGCTAWTYPGAERSWQITPSTSGPIDLALQVDGSDLDLFVLQGTGCGGTCVASSVSSGTLDEHLELQAAAGQTYTIVVDGYVAGASATYALDVQCGTPTCDATEWLACGDVLHTSNGGAGSTDDAVIWPCSNYAYTGPERAWTFVPTTSEPVTMAVSGLSGDLDLMVQAGGACVAGGCVASSVHAATQAETVTFDAVQGQSYTVIVDGYDETVSDFDLAVSCTPPGCHHPWSPGDADYCVACPCAAGEADCDSDAECSTGKCLHDRGSVWGYADNIDVCVAACVDDAWEPDDGPGVVGPGSYGGRVACDGDPDLTEVDLFAGDALAVTLDLDPAAGDAMVTVLDPSGAILASAGPGTLTVEALSDGVHTVVVDLVAEGWDATVGVPYDLDVLVEPGFRLEVSDLVAGREATVRVVGAPSGARVVLGRSRGFPTAGPCPPSLGGLCLDLEDPEKLGSRVIGPSGEETFTALLPSGTSPGIWTLQAVVASGAAPEKTPPVVREVVAP